MNARKHERLSFTPSAKARAYFDQLVRTLQRDRGLRVRVTQREAFDVLMVMAQKGERSFAARSFAERMVGLGRKKAS